MHFRNPYLQAGVFLALMFTAVAMTFGSFGRSGHHEHRKHRHHDHHQQHERQHQHEHQQSAKRYDSYTEISVVSPDAPNVSVRMVNNDREIELPTWPGCNDDNYDDRIECSIVNFVEFIRIHLQPMEGHRGRVIGLFDVDLKGKIINTELHEGEDPALTAETMRLVGLMQGADFRWTPGKINGKPQILKFGIGIQFGGGCRDCSDVEVAFFRMD